MWCCADTHWQRLLDCALQLSCQVAQSPTDSFISFDVVLVQMPTGNGSLVAPSTMPITLVIAQVDSDSLFHDYTQVCSGLIAMMGAMELLRATCKQPVLAPIPPLKPCSRVPKPRCQVSSPCVS